MKKTLKVALVLALTTIASCKTMKKEHFDSASKIVAVGVNLTYNGSPMPLDSGFPSFCQLVCKDQNKEDLFSKTKIKGNYLFFIEDNLNEITDKLEEINIESLHCMSSRVFYNKSRLRSIDNNNQNIFKHNTNLKSKIIYAGTIEIEWMPEIFKISDLFFTGVDHFGVEDEGSFSLRKRDEYDKFTEFMKKEFDKNKLEITNGSKR